MAVLAAAVLLLSLPGTPLQADQSVVSMPPLAPVTDTDGRFGLVQGIQSPNLAFQAGARWDRVVKEAGIKLEQ